MHKDILRGRDADIANKLLGPYASAKDKGTSKSKIKGSFLYIVAILCNVERCFRQLWCSSIITCNTISITHDHYTDI